MSVSLPHTIDSMFDSIGTKALQVMIVIAILTTIVIGVMMATGGDADRVASGLSRVVAVDWLLSGLQDLSASVSRASEAIKNYNIAVLLIEIGVIVWSMFAVVAGLLRIVVLGYADLAAFAVASVPPLVKPIGILMAVALIFVQFCVVWVVAKFLINVVSQIANLIAGR